jgi:UDP-N-acetylglucosamine:LPS N-acetylglucosamine transferase
MSEETEKDAVIWILIDHSSRQAAFEDVGEHLSEQGVEIQIVTITEVLGSVARDALTGGAERLLRGLRVAFQGRSSDEDLLGAVRRARPDVLAVTNGRYLRALGLLENLTGIKTLQVGVLANYNLSTDWMNSGVGAYVVPHADFRERLVANGARAERVLIAGPPIRPGFARDVDREAVRDEFGFGDSKSVLVRADSFPAKNLEKLVFQCSLVEGDVRFVFHHNGDQSTASTLRAAADKYGLPAAMFGSVPDLERFVVAADAVLAPVQDPYISELVVASRPMILVGADEDHASQSEFLVEQGAAWHIADVLRLGSELERALTDEDLDAMTGAAEGLGSREANRAVADALGSALEHAEEWMVSPATAPPDDGEPAGDGGDGEEAPESTGPFETIGRGSRDKSADSEAAPSSDSPGAEEPSRAPSRSYAGISKSEAKDQLAELILIERDIERELTEVTRQQERWRKRLDLAREWNEEDLAQEAEDVLREYLEEAKPLERELADVRRQKEKLKSAARGDAPSSADQPAGLIGDEREDGGRSRADMERRFQRLELDRDLDDLKDRIKRELGE